MACVPMTDESRDSDIEGKGELPRRESTHRAPQVSKRHADHEEAFFQHVDVVRRHLKPLLRFLLQQVGREWSVVVPEVEERCRREHIPREVREELVSIFRQIGNGKSSNLYSNVVHVDPDSGLIRRRDGSRD